jgi:hypothetical protein
MSKVALETTLNGIRLQSSTKITHHQVESKKCNKYNRSYFRSYHFYNPFKPFDLIFLKQHTYISLLKQPHFFLLSLFFISFFFLESRNDRLWLCPNGLLNLRLNLRRNLLYYLNSLEVLMDLRHSRGTNDGTGDILVLDNPGKS